jgi:cytochrome c556
MKRMLIAIVSCLAILAFCLPYASTAEEQQSKASSMIMKEKLKTSQKLLEGIALANFKTVTTSAEDLIRLTNTEEWMIHKTPKYELFTNEFRRAAENVIAKAKVKNIDGVTLAYFELTMSCVRCHTYVREIRDARLSGGPVVCCEQP